MNYLHLHEKSQQDLPIFQIFFFSPNPYSLGEVGRVDGLKE